MITVAEGVGFEPTSQGWDLAKRSSRDLARRRWPARSPLQAVLSPTPSSGQAGTCRCSPVRAGRPVIAVRPTGNRQPDVDPGCCDESCCGELLPVRIRRRLLKIRTW